MLTSEQLQQRKTGIGGSDASAVVGLSLYKTALDIYLDKTTEVLKEPTEAMRRGTILEPFVRSLFELETGWKVEQVLRTERKREHPFMIAHLDGFNSSERAVVELKTADYRTKENWGEEGSDEIPKEYLIQVAHYASVVDVETVHIGVLFGDESLFRAFMMLQKLREAYGFPVPFSELGYDFRLYTYKRTRELERKLINRERSFWFDHVQKKIPPSPQKGCVEDFLKAYPVAQERTVCVSGEEVKAIEDFREVKRRKKELEEQETLLKAELLSLFGEASMLVDSSHVPLATWKNKTTTSFDKSTFAKTYPDLCTQFTKSGTTRELRLV